MRARDALGRPVPSGSPDAVVPVAEEALAPADAIRLARRLLAQGRAFAAHEVLEACWRTAPADDRNLWQGLAQICVGLTHLQRGNRVGAGRLVRRGVGRLAGRPVQYGVDVPELVRQGTRWADALDAGEQVQPDLVL